MTPEELDYKARAWRAARKADKVIKKLDQVLSRSPRVNARSQLEWLERCALAGDLAPEGFLADYPAQGVRDTIATAYGPAKSRSLPTRG